MNILFFGTSSFAVPILEKLTRDPRFQIVAVVTQPDRPVGRHADMQAPPIKIAAEKFGLPVRQFDSIKTDEALAFIKSSGSDLAVVASFGQIIPQAALDALRFGMVNVHASLLPNYRGASPINAAILNGDKTTGVTIMEMDAQLDHGPILAQATEPIRSDDTAATLTERLAHLGAKIISDTLVKFSSREIQPREQNHAAATMTKLLKREDGKLRLDQSAIELERQVRAFDPWPGTFVLSDDLRLKVLKATVGSVSGCPMLTCKDGSALSLIRVQPEGKKPMDGRDFLRGFQNNLGKKERK